MNKTHLAALAAALLAAPLAYAHVDGLPYGTPKFYCEDSPLAGDQLTHDYGPPGTGLFMFVPADYSMPNGLYPLLPGGCNFAATVPNQWDGHFEYALGGAILLACDGPGGCGDGTGDGSSVCFGTYSDHSAFPTVWVFDHVLSGLGTGVAFTVAADYGPGPCGDGLVDPFPVNCVDHCVVPFPPGNDGAYYVFVSGTMGHVWST